MSEKQEYPRTEMVVVTIYKMLKSGGEYDPNHKDAVRGPVMVNRIWADEINLKSSESGRLCVIDEEETERRTELRRQTIIAKREQKDTALKAQAALMGIMSGKAVAAPAAPKPAKKKPAVKNDDDLS